MVDDEARGGAEAAWSESVVVAVAGEDEDVGVLSGCDDFVFDASAACLAPGGSPQARLSVGEQFVCGLLGDRL